MKYYKLAYNAPNHYILHDMRDKSMFHVAKKGLDEETHQSIKNLPPMKEDKASNYDNDMPDNRDIPGTDPRALDKQPQHFDEGGEATEEKHRQEVRQSFNNALGPKSIVHEQPKSAPQPLPERSAYENVKEFFGFDEGGTVPTPKPKLTPVTITNPSTGEKKQFLQYPDGIIKQNYAEGGDVLDANARSHIAEHNFALPGGRYPIHDITHARNALARVAQHGSPEEQSKVRAAVHKKYPSIGKYAEGGPVLDPTAQEINQEIDNPAQPAPEIPETVESGVRPGAPAAMATEELAAQEQADKSAPAPQPGEGTYAAPEQVSQLQEPIAPPQEVTSTEEPITEKPSRELQQPQVKQSALEKDLAENQARYTALAEKQDATDKRFSDLVAQNKIDPDRYMNDKNLGQKIMMGLGLGLSGVGSALAHQSNNALDMLNHAIDRDIEAQKNDQSQSVNLWKMNHESLKDQQAATLQTRNQILEGAKVKMDELLGNAPGPMALARAQELKGKINSEILQNKMSILRTKMIQDAYNNQDNPQKAGALSQKDPASLVPFLVQNPEQQKEIFKEIQDAQNITSNGPKILEAYDQAVKDKSLGSLKINPASVNALHQLMLPLFKDIDGTVRQAAMDESFKNLTPVLLDSAQKDNTRRQALVNWIDSKRAAPTAKANFIDLSKFASTAGNIGGQIKSFNGARYQQVPGGWKKIQ